MASLVCTGATLQCSFGSASADFAASGTQTSAGDAAGVVTDVASANVPSFGTCSSMSNPQVASAQGAPQPCKPVLEPWSPGSKQVTIGGVSALDDASTCTCAWEGVVKVNDAGQDAVSVQ